MRDSSASAALSTAVFLHKEAADPAVQNAQLSVSFGEKIEAGKIRDTWNGLLAAKALLRAGIYQTPEGCVLREAAAREMRWQHLDWTKDDREGIPVQWGALLASESAMSFALEGAPLFRGVTIELPGGGTHLLLTFPQCLLSEEEIYRLLSEYLAAIDGQAPAYETEISAASPGDASTDWWKEHAKAAPFALTLHPASDALRTPASVSHLYQRDDSRELHQAASKLGVSLGSLVQGVAAIVIGRLGSAPEFTWLSNPPGVSHLLPTPISLKGGQTFSDWITAFELDEQERAAHAGVSLPGILPVLGRRVAEYPIAFRSLPAPVGDRIQAAQPRWMNFDAKVMIRPLTPVSIDLHDGSRVSLEIFYTADRWTSGQADRVLARLMSAIAVVLADPEIKLDALTGALDTDSLPAVACVPLPSAGKSFEERICDTAAKLSTELAVQGEGEAALSYGDLLSHAQSLASYLKQENLAEGWVIAVCLVPTPWLPVALLGIALAGDTCVALDPEAAQGWLADKAASCDAELVICDSRTASFFEGGSRRVLVIDQHWETISAAPVFEKISHEPKTSYLLLGTESDPAPRIASLQPDFVGSVLKESIARWRLRPGSSIPLNFSAGTGAFLELLLSALASGATLLLPPTSSVASSFGWNPTHLRLSLLQWRNLLAELRRGAAALPGSLRAVAIEAAAVPADLFAEWLVFAGEEIATHIFWSPVSNSGLGIRSFVKGGSAATLPATGFPTPGLSVTLADALGRDLPPHIEGEAVIKLLDGDQDWKMPAWRDEHGAFYFLAENCAEAKIRQTLGVLDAVVAEVDQRRGAWVLRKSDVLPANALEQINGVLSTARKLDFVQEVDLFPLSPVGELKVAALPTPARIAKPQPKAKPEPAPAPKAAAAPKVAEARPPEPATAAQPAPQPAPQPVRRDWEPLVLLSREPATPNLILVHDAGGDPAVYEPLAATLRGDWTIYATAARGFHQPDSCHEAIEDEAAALVRALVELDPVGPYHLFGYGYGSLLAYEMARQLREANRPVHYLALAGTPPELQGGKVWLRSFTRLFSGQAAQREIPATPAGEAHLRATRAYRPAPLDGPAGVILGSDQGRDVENAWLNAIPEGFVERVTNPVASLLDEPGVKRLAVILREWAVPTADE